MNSAAAWPFGDLPMFGFNVIYVDPAWPFDNYSAKGESRNAKRHYGTMTLEQIAALPVGHLAADNCACFLWVTDPLLDRAIAILKGWGFAYKTVAFTWAKRTKLDTGWHMGTGYTTRSNPETCLLGMIGTLPRRSAGVRQLIVEPVREHSRKPDRVPEDIVRLYGNVPRVELFARTKRPGWASWGDQTDRFQQGEAA